MKLSEAIRLGAMVKPQAFGDGPVYGTEDSSCALRAATDALGIPETDGHHVNYPALHRRFPFLLDRARCPVAECCPSLLFGEQVVSTIYHLNDRHHWTREAIADWVATVEPADELVAPLAPAEAVSA